MKRDLPRRVFRGIIWAAVLVTLFAFGIRHSILIQPVVYTERLDEVAVTVDGEDLTLRDLSFYVLYEEQTIESEAMVYNKDNTRDYWNLHANGIFFKYAAKKYVMDMAVHDHIFYKAALDEGMKLTPDEKQAVDDSFSDFTDDLFLQQLDSPLYDKELIYETMEHIALAEKYRDYIAARDETTYAGYAYDGYDYKKLLEDHSVRINKRVWDRVAIGDNSLVHESANAINGREYSDE